MIVIFVRKTEDRDTFTIDELAKKIDKEFSSGFVIDSKMVQKIKRWDKIMKIPYFKYRSLLKSLAETTYINCKACYTIDELDNIGDDDFICPADDDDWFRPDLSEAIPKLIQSHDVLCWDQVVHTTHLFRPHRWYQWHPDETMNTNNYCVRGRLFKSLTRHQKKLIMMDENLVETIMSNSNVAIQKTNELLSCYLWHIGGLSFMSSNDVASNHIILPEKCNIDDDDMKWTQSYFDLLAQINNLLSPSDPIKFE